MESQLKKGFLDILILACLCKEPSYGYKIVKDIEDISNISESTLYPILRRLEIQRLVKTYTEPINGRLRKYYSITFEGKNKIADFKNELYSVEQIIEYIKEQKI